MTKMNSSRTSSARGGRRGYVPEPPPRPTSCEHPGCAEAGLYRAPKSRAQLTEYYWFCLDHVREYNQTWDYYAGMDQAEIERHIREDLVGGRPTWPLGKWGSHGPMGRVYRDDKFRAKSEFIPDDVEEALNGGRKEREARRRDNERKRRLSKEMQALAILDLKPPVNFDEIKARYKMLVKRLHPDANGGDKSAEERLKLVNQAYSTLKAAALT